jgi:uncharacterized protein YdhG (YjbR/CyaY superfamily)
MSSLKFKTVDEYFIAQSEIARERLQKIRETVCKAAPHAEEVISYAMPAFRQNGIILWYAAAKYHYALYIEPSIKNDFKDKLTEFVQTKSAIHFPYDRIVPVKLITEIVKYKVKLNSVKAKKSKVKK